MTMYERLNGKQLEVKYETGANYRMTYLSENELKWEALSEVAEGEATTGTEPYWAYEVAEGIYHIDWIEQDGMTAAQTVDFNKLQATAFLTWGDESERGGRGKILMHGTITVIG